MKVLNKLLFLLVVLLFSAGGNFTFARTNNTIHFKLNKKTKPMVNDDKINDDAGSEDQESSAIAMNKYGLAVICWEDSRNGDSDIYAQIISSMGFKFKGNFKVNDDIGTTSQVAPDVAIDNRGCFIIVWEDYRHGYSDVDIYAQRFEANGEPIGPNFKVNDDEVDTEQRFPAIAMAGNGNFVVCWKDGRYPHGIYYQRFDYSGTPLHENDLIVNDVVISCHNPAIDMNESGTFVICWRDERNSPDEIYAQRFDSTGSPLGSNFEVSDIPDQSRNVYRPTVAVHENGDFMICWHYIWDLGIHANLYDADGIQIRDIFQVNAIGFSDNNDYPAVTANPNNGYSVVWQTTREIDWDIYRQNFDEAGNAIGGNFRVNDPSRIQKKPCIASDTRGISIIAWEDDREFNYDIYAAAGFPLFPLNLIAGTGFNGIVPLSWDPLYATEGITNYNIYRSTTSGGPYTMLTSVNLSDRGILGALMRDWIDTDVTNGTTYYYAVRADISGWESPYSEEASATPYAEGYEILSNWATTSPTINGKIGSGEWNDAATIDISNPYASTPIMLYVKNDANFLYIAVDDPNDDNINEGNLIGILFDEDHNELWDETSPSSEGVITISTAAALFTGYWGKYPNYLGADIPTSATGVDKEISDVTGHVQYEVSLDLTTSPLNAAPLETIGFGIWIDDPGNFYPYHYHNAAIWPPGGLWETASTLGDLILADKTDIAISQFENKTPKNYFLSQNYPNPFNPATLISYDLPKSSYVILKVYNIQGQEIKTLVNEFQPEGMKSVTWDGLDNEGKKVTSSVYFYRIEAGNFSVSKKMILVQ